MKLIDADKLLEWLSTREGEAYDNAAKTYSPSFFKGKAEAFKDVLDYVNVGHFDPTPPVQPDTPKHGDRVLHGIYGMGTVVSGVYVPAPTVIVDLDKSARFHPVPITELEVITDDPST